MQFQEIFPVGFSLLKIDHKHLRVAFSFSNYSLTSNTHPQLETV